MKKGKESVKRILKDIKEYGPAGIVFLAYYLLIHVTKRPFCPLLNLTGFPCAGCGLTRAFLYIARGELDRAVYINPMAFLILLFLAYCGFFRYIRGTQIKGFRTLFILLMVCTLSFYAVRMYLYFPDRVPYVYNRNNVLAHRIPGYEDLTDRLLQMIKDLRS